MGCGCKAWKQWVCNSWDLVPPPSLKGLNLASEQPPAYAQGHSPQKVHLSPPSEAQTAGKIRLVCSVTELCPRLQLFRGNSLYPAQNNSSRVLLAADAPHPCCPCSQGGDSDAEVGERSLSPSFFPRTFLPGQFFLLAARSSPPGPQEGQHCFCF